MGKLYYSISEVAAQLGESVSTVRFWANTFDKFLNPRRNAKGNRMFVGKEVEMLGRIKYLTRDCGLSLEATARKLKDRDGDGDKLLKVRESLLKIRERLVQIQQTL